LSVLATGWWFSACTLVSSTNKTDCYNRTEILLKVALNTITLNLYLIYEGQAIKWSNNDRSTNHYIDNKRLSNTNPMHSGRVSKKVNYIPQQ
jgi:hypothetical protein